MQEMTAHLQQQLADKEATLHRPVAHPTPAPAPIFERVTGLKKVGRSIRKRIKKH